jgi:hypothetical protein
VRTTPPTARRTLAAELLRLRALDLPGSTGTVIGRGGLLRFDFDARPFVGAREYRCRVELERAARSAEAYVLRPDLQLIAGERPPHIYDHSEGHTRLCLYMPGGGEWHAGLWLSETVLPWTIEWLRYYEIWLIDGVWQGGGEHPDAEPRRRYGVREKRLGWSK